MANLYLISAKTRGYDVYSEAVVVALTSLEARKIHPSGRNSDFDDDNYAWVPWTEVTARRIGVAAEGLKEGEVVIASFHAG